jgi:hypothetical protein
MRVALAWVAMAVMSTFAAADTGHNGPAACPTGAKLVELVRQAFPDVDDRCPRDARHVYAWKAGKLIEL